MATTATLTEANYRELKTALAHITPTVEALESAMRAGIPLDEELAKIKLTQYQIETILREYFPTRP